MPNPTICVAYVYQTTNLLCTQTEWEAEESGLGREWGPVCSAPRCLGTRLGRPERLRRHPPPPPAPGSRPHAAPSACHPRRPGPRAPEHLRAAPPWSLGPRRPGTSPGPPSCRRRLGRPEHPEHPAQGTMRERPRLPPLSLGRPAASLVRLCPAHAGPGQGARRGQSPRLPGGGGGGGTRGAYRWARPWKSPSATHARLGPSSRARVEQGRRTPWERPPRGQRGRLRPGRRGGPGPRARPVPLAPPGDESRPRPAPFSAEATGPRGPAQAAARAAAAPATTLLTWRTGGARRRLHRRPAGTRNRRAGSPRPGPGPAPAGGANPRGAEGSGWSRTDAEREREGRSSRGPAVPAAWRARRARGGGADAQMDGRPAGRRGGAGRGHLGLPDGRCPRRTARAGEGGAPPALPPSSRGRRPGRARLRLRRRLGAPHGRPRQAGNAGVSVGATAASSAAAPGPSAG